MNINGFRKDLMLSEASRTNFKELKKEKDKRRCLPDGEEFFEKIRCQVYFGGEVEWRRKIISGSIKSEYSASFDSA